MKHKPIDKITLVLVALLICIVTFANLFQTERPTISEEENRVLATMPTLSFQTLTDGSYFSDLAAYFSDTFIQRDVLVRLSKSIDKYKSLAVLFGELDFSVIIDPNATVPPPTEEEPLPTLPPLTQPPQTNPPTDPPTQPTEPSGSDPTEPTQPPVIPITLSDSTLKLDAGSTRQVVATLGTGYGQLVWSSDNESIAFVTDSRDGTAIIKGLNAGAAAVSATVTNLTTGETATVVCLVTVTTPEIKPPDNVADFLPNGLFIYDGAAYSQSWFVESAATKLADIYERFSLLFPESQVSVVVAPLATITITDQTVLSKIQRQEKILDKLEATIKGDVNFVNLKNVYMAHNDEYLYFKSDHHWTHRGAYYAYAEFVESLGMTPTPIEDFEKKVLTETYIGSMAGYTGDDRVKKFYDDVEAYIPTKGCTMTITDSKIGTFTRDFCINLSYKNYLAFINGDFGYTVINVPENPQDKTILVLKDSYGNAFVPYLTEHYGNIVVIDPRYASIKVLEKFADTNFTDIVFMYNTSTANNSAWYKYFYNMIS